MAAPSAAPRRSRPAGHGEVSVGSFRRLEEIGRGSFATVYKATYTKKPGYVAIKSVDMNKLNKKLKENLYSEIHILKRLHHPHIVALIDCQETSAHIHLVMEFCQLGDLSYFIKKRDTLARHEATADMIRKYPNPPSGGLNEVVVRHFLKQLASALKFLRDGNFIHRDVKPQNLLLDPSPLFYAKAKPETVPYAAHDQSLIPVAGVESLPTLKIADFGFARSLPSTSLAETLCGSPLYMAPEILRYEKYDAKADLWSVGTVLYEMMTGKPPFRASNHVELLRKIERGEDRIKFPEETTLMDSMKKLIRGLLKRNPVERISFNDFFNHTVIKDQIPGLVDEDRPAELPKRPTESPQEKSAQVQPHELVGEPKNDGKTIIKQSPRHSRTVTDNITIGRTEQPVPSKLSRTPPESTPYQVRTPERRFEPPGVAQDLQGHASKPRRPSIVSHATAPANQGTQNVNVRQKPAVRVREQSSDAASLPRFSTPSEQNPYQNRQSQSHEQQVVEDNREVRERAAQDVAFERDYVVVEKRAVEVNALADELASSPRIRGGAAQVHQDSQRGALVRRATTQGPSHSPPGAQVTPSRAMHLASGKRPDQLHHRQSSYERRLRDPGSATSAISKAINMASGRLLNMGFSPPLGLGRGGPSPPSYNPFPAYPSNQANANLIGDGVKGSFPADEDLKAVRAVEEYATRSDVVYGFAEVKYKQLIPLAPSMEQGLGLCQAGGSVGDDRAGLPNEDEGLTVDAILTLSEEALVLYVKALSLLARSMDIAGAWWARKSRGEVVESTSPKSQTQSSNSVAVGNRVNNVVQWVRSRFNEVLEKAEFVRLKLIEAQGQLPADHSNHPIDHPRTSHSAGGLGTSADHVIVSPGTTAEKLMYDRALEMSRTAAVNELVGEDLGGCEIAYVTAIRMLEAILEDDESPQKKLTSTEREPTSGNIDENSINGVQAEDRKIVIKLVTSIRSRLAALKRKLQVVSKRTSAVQPPVDPSRPSANPTATTAPAIANSPPP
ncbi:MAG: hypothetical protein LQ342_007321 [Letrouitia transgressa]|nr:MAG: hypothetical protein LQ342_007321 [Letrouitia transgressa]